MAENPRSPVELNLKEWEFLPDDTSFLEFGFEDVKAILCKDIIDADYFMSEPCKLIRHSPDINNQDEEVKTKIELEGEEPMDYTRSTSSDPMQRTPESDLSLQEIEPTPPSLVMEEKASVREEKEVEKEKAIGEGIGVGIWNWRLTVVGALCSIGAAAAATICVVVLGGRDGDLPPRCRHPRHVQFHIHGEDQRLTKVVEEASKLNQALAAARDMPAMMRAANISFGGYHDKPLIY